MDSFAACRYLPVDAECHRLLCVAIALELSCRVAELALRRCRGIEYDPAPRIGLTGYQRGVIGQMIRGELEYYTHSPVYGWTIKPGGAHGRYHANAQGLRGDREYPPAPTGGVVRLACFGDSFTHGDDVDNPDAWAAVLDRSAPGTEVLNFGVGGFGVDQAYLRFVNEGAAFHPDVVLIGFMTGDISRHVNVFRPFVSARTEMPLAKPRYHIVGGKLTLWPNPLPALSDYRALLDDPEHCIRRLRENDYYARRQYGEGLADCLAGVRLAKMARHILLSGPRLTERGVFNRQTEQYRVTLMLIEQFAADVAHAGAVPVVVLFPDRRDLSSMRKIAHAPYEPLREDLAAHGCRVVDMYDAFREVADQYRVKELTHEHYTALGNRIVAEYIRQWTVDHGLLPPPDAHSMAPHDTGTP